MRDNMNRKVLADKVLAIGSSCDLKFFCDYLTKENIFRNILYNFDLGTSDDASIEIRRENNIFESADIAVASIAQTMKGLIHPLILDEHRDWETLFCRIEAALQDVLGYLHKHFEYSFVFTYPFDRTLLDINDRPWNKDSKSYWLSQIYNLQIDLLKNYNNKIDLLDFEEAVLPAGYLNGVFREEIYGGHPEMRGAILTAELFLEKIISRIDISNKIKAIALDLDNTLWNGVYLESSVPPPVYMQRAWMLCQHAHNGIPICIISKNNPEDTDKITKYIMEAHPQLHRYIVKYYISWERKSQAILQMQKDLEIDASSIAFFDDDASERYEVKSSIPTVRVYTEKEIIKSNRYAEFSFYHISSDARNRVERYVDNVKRKAFEEGNILPLDEYLKSLELKIVFRLANMGDLDRAEELIQRTNQQNLLLNRTKRELIGKYIEKEQCILISLSDKFGDYGVIGCLVYRIEDSVINLIELAISCRALGKGIEECIVSFMSNYFSSLADNITFLPHLNYKNRGFYEKLLAFGFQHDERTNEMNLILKNTNHTEYPEWICVEDQTSLKV